MSNFLFPLIKSVLELVIWVFLLRVLLQLVRADFYNPISQLVWKVTRPVVDPVGRIVPRWRRLELSAAILLTVSALLYIYAINWLYGPETLDLLQALFLAIMKTLSVALWMYTLALLVVSLLSWFGPGTANPAANVLWSLTEPVLRPVRRVIQPISGLDLSPIPVMIMAMALNKYLQARLGLYY
jgi:YggT family protein